MNLLIISLLLIGFTITITLLIKNRKDSNALNFNSNKNKLIEDDVITYIIDFFSEINYSKALVPEEQGIKVIELSKGNINLINSAFISAGVGHLTKIINKNYGNNCKPFIRKLVNRQNILFFLGHNLADVFADVTDDIKDTDYSESMTTESSIYFDRLVFPFRPFISIERNFKFFETLYDDFMPYSEVGVSKMITELIDSVNKLMKILEDKFDLKLLFNEYPK